MRYYSIHRPVGPGTFPRTAPVKEIHNFDRRTYCPEINRHAWGWIEYEGTISLSAATNYDLVPEGGKDGQ